MYSVTRSGSTDGEVGDETKLKSDSARLFMTVSKAGTHLTFHDFQFLPAFKEIVANLPLLLSQQKHVPTSSSVPSAPPDATAGGDGGEGDGATN